MANRYKRRRYTRIFVGCEGQSEQGYIRLLQQFIDDAGIAIRIDSHVLTGAGDPLELAQKSLARIKIEETHPMRKYKGRFLVLDTDRLGQSRDRNSKLLELVKKTRLSWSGRTFASKLSCFAIFQAMRMTMLPPVQRHSGDCERSGRTTGKE